MCSCFFVKQKTAYDMRISDWSSDVCSSDLDILGDMALDGVEERLRLLRHAQVVEFGLKFDFGHLGLRWILPEKVSGAVLSMKMIGANKRYSPRSEEHTSELQSLMRISYAVFCLKKKNN